MADDAPAAVVLLCRDSAEAKLLADAVHLDGRLTAIIVEQGTAARRRKLDRMLQQGDAVGRVLKLLDVLAVVLYGRIVQAWLRRRVLSPAGVSSYPAGVPRWTVDDANDAECIERLRDLAPDTVVVLGTAILREPVLSLPIAHTLNVHGGLVPAYRNVHSDLWALLRRDTANIGTSILHLDAGVDTGDVALADRIAVQRGDGILRIKQANLELAVDLVRRVMQRIDLDALPRTPQEGEPGVFPTPNAAQVARLLWTRAR